MEDNRTLHDEIIKNLELIKELIINEDNDILLNNINLTLKKEISRIKKKNNNLLPIEIMKRIFLNLDIKELYNLKTVYKYWTPIIDNVIEEKIVYSIIFNQCRNKQEISFFVRIRCVSCSKRIADNMSCREKYLDIKRSCSKCKYKSITDIDDILKKISNFEIIYIFDENNYQNNEVVQNQLFDLIDRIYYESDVINTKLLIIDNNKYYSNTENEEIKNKIKLIVENVLNNTKQEVCIHINNLYKLEINIDNEKLKKLTIPINLLLNTNKLNLLYLEYIYIYGRFKDYENLKILKLYDKICKSSKLKEIVINKENIKLLKDYMFPKSIILEIIICNFHYDRELDNLFNIIKNNKIKIIKLYNINEYYIENLNNCLYVNKIIIDKKYNFKYIKKYNKIKYR